MAEQRNRVRLIASVTVIWSVMTALSGAAGSFLPLLLCRIGVGIGEAGLTPALVSMLADRFPIQRRAADCLAASAAGLQHALLAATIVLPLAALHYWRAGLALRREAAGLAATQAAEA